MVYIHGGGFITGDNGLDLPGTVRNLVSRGVVVASIQYRLGFLGNNFYARTVANGWVPGRV
jgi:carboxylesterase type B